MKKIIFGLLGLSTLLAFSFQRPDSNFQLNDRSFTPVSQDSLPANIQKEMERLGKEMEKLGAVMEQYGAEMEKHGKAIERGDGNYLEHTAAMEALGKKMEKQGNEMEKLGNVMEKYGQEIERRHHEMMNWFFKSLQKDGLVQQLPCKLSLFMENETLLLNGKPVDAAKLQQYKQGLESRWGQPFKTDYSMFFKGEVREDGKGGVKLDGNMNTDF